MKKIAFKTLGCRLNLYETDALASQFVEKGYSIVGFNDDADAYVVNTCTVTNQSDQKCRQFIHQVRRDHPQSLIVAVGCMVNHRKEELLSRHDVDYAVDNERKSALFGIIDGHLNGQPSDPEGFDKDLFGYEHAFSTFHTRSLIKIHDGCNNFCSYCIIPRVRGRETSRPTADIYDNIRQVIDHGFKEIVLTGVNMGRYNYEGTDFEHLVENILAMDGDFRVHISSIEPDNFSRHFMELFLNPKLSPHMHICLQSGSTTTLERMNRHYTAAQFEQLCSDIREVVPMFNITTDIIVGFPGETEEEFRESAQLAKSIGFSHIHTFKYSIRNGTRAAVMPDQIPDKIKSERSEVIRQISSDNRKRYFEQMLGRAQRMLVERIDADGTARGYGENYIPIRLKHASVVKNTFVDVRLTEIIGKGDNTECLAQLVDKQ